MYTIYPGRPWRRVCPEAVVFEWCTWTKRLVSDIKWWKFWFPEGCCWRRKFPGVLSSKRGFSKEPIYTDVPQFTSCLFRWWRANVPRIWGLSEVRRHGRIGDRGVYSQTEEHTRSEHLDFIVMGHNFIGPRTWCVKNRYSTERRVKEL